MCGQPQFATALSEYEFPVVQLNEGTSSIIQMTESTIINKFFY